MENKKWISPSLMCGSLDGFGDMLRTFEREGIEMLHIDVMDGEFVPNLQFGTSMIEQIRKMTSIPLDIHLMIGRPEDKLDWFGIRKGEWVSVHYESTAHVQKALAGIRARGGRAMLALNPATPLCVLENVLDDCDGILIMTVNPGFAGQAIIPATIKKVTALRKLLDENGYAHLPIEVDGNVSFVNAKLLSEAGANIFVAGSSSVYHKDLTLEEGIHRLRGAIAF